MYWIFHLLYSAGFIFSERLLFSTSITDLEKEFSCTKAASLIFCGHICLKTADCMNFRARRSNKNVFKCCLFESKLIQTIIPGVPPPIDENTCSSETALPIGMESREITDAQISSSSDRSDKHNAKEGRLNGDIVWCSAIGDTNQYLQVDMVDLKTVVALAHQGHPLKENWVIKFALYYSIDGVVWREYTNNDGTRVIFQGNEDNISTVKTNLPTPIEARQIRVNPIEYQGLSVCMRIEIYACDVEQ